VPEKVQRLVEQMKALTDEIDRLKKREAANIATELVALAEGGVVVARRDGLGPDELRQLAQATLRALGSGVVALLGAGPGGDKAGIVVTVSKDRVEAGASAAEVAAPGARALGGGTAKNPELVVGGGPNVGAIDDALALVREQAVAWRQ
jgi:alanyl-tRNA synthetase